MGKCYRKLNWAVRFEVLTTISMISPTVFLDVSDTHQAARYQTEEDYNVLLSSPWRTQCWAAIYHNTMHHISQSPHMCHLPHKTIRGCIQSNLVWIIFIRRGRFVTGLCKLPCHSAFWASRDQLRSPSRDTPREARRGLHSRRLNQYAPASEQL
jgi:hypothetical protein